MGGNCSGIILRGHRILRSGPIGGPDEVVCALGAVLIASDVSGHTKIALGTPCATVESRSGRNSERLAHFALQRGSDPDWGHALRSMHPVNRY